MELQNFVVILVGLFYTHWFADFWMQTRFQADNKGKWMKSAIGRKALLSHVSVYAACMTGATLFLYGAFAPKTIFDSLQFAWVPLLFGVVNFVLHLVTDATTSQFTGMYWMRAEENRKAISEAPLGTDIDASYLPGDNEYVTTTIEDERRKMGENVHSFFAVIGIDQFIHAACIILTTYFILV